MENEVYVPQRTTGKEGVSLLSSLFASQASTDAKSHLGEVGLLKDDWVRKYHLYTREILILQKVQKKSHGKLSVRYGSHWTLLSPTAEMGLTWTLAHPSSTGYCRTSCWFKDRTFPVSPSLQNRRVFYEVSETPITADGSLEIVTPENGPQIWSEYAMLHPSILFLPVHSNYSYMHSKPIAREMQFNLPFHESCHLI